MLTQTFALIDGLDVPDSTPDDGWGAWICEVVDAVELLSVSDDLRGILNGVDQSIEAEIDLARYLGLAQPTAKDLAMAQSGGVRFMSMSMSKGLTVEASIVIAAEEGIMPRTDADIAEERRLLYVALTRARRFQFVTWSARRTGPTARSGSVNVRGRRTESRFLRNGPVASQRGSDYIARRSAGDA